jgi:hypothetical protein
MLPEQLSRRSTFESAGTVCPVAVSARWRPGLSTAGRIGLSVIVAAYCTQPARPPVQQFSQLPEVNHRQDWGKWLDAAGREASLSRAALFSTSMAIVRGR